MKGSTVLACLGSKNLITSLEYYAEIAAALSSGSSLCLMFSSATNAAEIKQTSISVYETVKSAAVYCYFQSVENLNNDVVKQQYTRGCRLSEGHPKRQLTECVSDGKLKIYVTPLLPNQPNSRSVHQYDPAVQTVSLSTSVI